MASRAFRAAVSMLALGIGCVSIVQAQRAPYAYAERDGVWTWKTSDQPMAALKLSAAERQAVSLRRDRIAEVLQSSQVLNPLKGFPVRADKTIVARGDNEGRIRLDEPIMSLVGATIGYFRLDKASGRVDPFTIETPRLEIVTNDLMTVAGTWAANRFWYEYLYDEAGREVFLEPRVVTTTEDGRPVYALDAFHETVIVSNGRPLWVPVTGEQFLRAMVKYARDRKAREDENERQSGRPPLPANQSGEGMRLRACEQELAALPASQRQRPAYWAPAPADQPLLTGLTSGDARGARPVVMMNPEYFDPAMPRTAVQLILCRYNYQRPYESGRPEDAAPDIAVATLQRLVKHLEYGKLEALIEKAPRTTTN